MTRKDYFAREEVSKSVLKELSKDPRLAKQMIDGGFKKSTNALDIGTALDTLMFDGYDALNLSFHNMSFENPFPNATINMGKFMKALESLVLENPSNDYNDLYQTAYDIAGIKKPDLESHITMLKDSNALQYLDDLKLSIGKIVLSSSDFALIGCMRNSLMNSEYFGNLFRVPSIGVNSYKYGNNEEVLYQHVIVWDGKKIMLDLVYINHNEKTIRPIDLKTTSENANSVNRSFITYGYHLQAGMYHDGVVHWANIEYPEYKVVNEFEFIFIDKRIDSVPFSITIKDDDLFKCKEGGKIREEMVKGYKKLIEEYNYHKEINNWTLPYDILFSGNNNKVIKLFDA